MFSDTVLRQNPGRLAEKWTSPQISVRAAVLGLYSSGSTATAGVLYCLGLCMGMPLEPDHFEPKDLARKLRRWWDEPNLTEQVGAAERVEEIRRWRCDLDSQGYAAVGVKHPLLALSPDDLRDAWGAATKFIWSWRPVEASIKSLCRRAWWPGHEERIQTRLWDTLGEFFSRVAHLRVNYDDLLQSPESQIDLLVEYLGLNPTADQRRDAVMFVRRRGTADG